MWALDAQHCLCANPCCLPALSSAAHGATGYAEEAPGSEEEEELLTELLGACLGGSEHGLHDGLLADLLALSDAQVQCAKAEVPQEQMKAISISCGDALGSLKMQVLVLHA